MITGPELRYLTLQAALAAAGVQLVAAGDYYWLGFACFCAQGLLVWVLRDARRAARLAALDEFDRALLRAVIAERRQKERSGLN